MKEKSLNSKATCRECRVLINEGVTRVGIQKYETDKAGWMQYFHLTCCDTAAVRQLRVNHAFAELEEWNEVGETRPQDKKEKSPNFWQVSSLNQREAASAILFSFPAMEIVMSGTPGTPPALRRVWVGVI
jgi:hypothetical protein